jgi:hypothetical protein
MVLTVSFVLSPVIGLSCHRRLRIFTHRLDASVEASGPHDFAVRSRCPRQKHRPASTASRPAFVTIAIRPSSGTRRCGFRSDLGKRKTGIFLPRELDRQPKSAGVGNQVTHFPSGRLADLSDFVTVSSSFVEGAQLSLHRSLRAYEFQREQLQVDK